MKNQKNNIFLKLAICVLIVLLGASIYVNISKANQITDLESQIESAIYTTSTTCELTEYEKLKSENQNLSETNSEYGGKIEELKIKNALLAQERDTAKSKLLTVTNSLSDAKNELTTIFASHTVIYIDENYNTIYSERVQNGDSVQNIPAVPSKGNFHAEWSADGTNIQSDTVIYARYYYNLSFTFKVKNNYSAGVIFDKSEAVKIYENQELEVFASDAQRYSLLQIDSQPILTATLSSETSLVFWIEGWYFGDDDSLYLNEDAYQMSGDTTATAFVDTNACILSGSKITMADGSEKNVEDIQSGDYILSYDYKAGAIQPKKVLALLAGNSLVDVLTVKLNNDSELKIADIEYLFDTDAKEFIEVSIDTVDELVGKNVMINNNGQIATAQIASVETSQEQVDHYTLYVAESHNYIANGIIAHIAIGVMNLYEIGDDFKVDAAQYAANVARYGTYTYDQFSDVISEEIFNAFNVKDTKFLVEQGLTTFKYIHDGMGVIQQEIEQANQ